MKSILGDEEMHICNESEELIQHQEGVAKIRTLDEWKKVNKKQILVYARAKCHCEYCGKDLLTTIGDNPLIRASAWAGIDIEHILPRSKKGDDCACNKALACKSCHAIKSELEKKKDISYFDTLHSINSRNQRMSFVQSHLRKRAEDWVNEAIELQKYFSI